MSEPIKEEEEIAETDNTENPELNEVCKRHFDISEFYDALT